MSILLQILEVEQAAAAASGMSDIFLGGWHDKWMMARDSGVHDGSMMGMYWPV
jgi:hypothetical protein